MSVVSWQSTTVGTVATLAVHIESPVVARKNTERSVSNIKNVRQ